MERQAINLLIVFTFLSSYLSLSSKCIKLITEDESGPVIHTSLQAFVEDLMEEEDRFGVEENRTDVFVRAWRPVSQDRNGFQTKNEQTKLS